MIPSHENAPREETSEAFKREVLLSQDRQLDLCNAMRSSNDLMLLHCPPSRVISKYTLPFREVTLPIPTHDGRASLLRLVAKDVDISIQDYPLRRPGNIDLSIVGKDSDSEPRFTIKKSVEGLWNVAIGGKVGVPLLVTITNEDLLRILDTTIGELDTPTSDQWKDDSGAPTNDHEYSQLFKRILDVSKSQVKVSRQYLEPAVSTAVGIVTNQTSCAFVVETHSKSDNMSTVDLSFLVMELPSKLLKDGSDGFEEAKRTVRLDVRRRLENRLGHVSDAIVPKVTMLLILSGTCSRERLRIMSETEDEEELIDSVLKSLSDFCEQQWLASQIG